MSVTRMPAAPPPQRTRAGTRLLGAGTLRRRHRRRGIARRRWIVALTKRLLPLAAVALLATVALWPEYHRDSDAGRVAYRRGSLMPESGQLTDARYHGVDEHGRPYTITANIARQSSPERIDLTRPAGDVSLESGTWLMVRAEQGVYLQHAQQLDLSGDVHLYRDDGTTLATDSATLDLKAGAAAGAEMVHAEGPFGTLDAQGFAVTDRGAVIQFTGPGRLVLNGAASANERPAAPPCWRCRRRWRWRRRRGRSRSTCPRAGRSRSLPAAASSGGRTSTRWLPPTRRGRCAAT